MSYRALAELRHEIRRFLNFSERKARAAGLEPQQHQLLLALKGLPDGLRPTVSVLAQRLELRHHSVVELIDRSVAARLVARRRSAIDRREIRVEITARGERLLQRLSLAHRAELKTAGPTLVQALEVLIAELPRRRFAVVGTRR